MKQYTYEGRDVTIVGDLGYNSTRVSENGDTQSWCAGEEHWVKTAHLKPKALKTSPWYFEQDKKFNEELLNWLGTGRKNAKTAAKILQEKGFITEAEAVAYSRVDTLSRQLRLAAEKKRIGGKVVSSTNGYFIAETEEETQKFVDTQKSSAHSRLKNAEALELSMQGE